MKLVLTFILALLMFNSASAQKKNKKEAEKEQPPVQTQS